MSSPCRYAAVIIDRCIRPAMRSPGGRICRSMHWRSQEVFGSKAIPRPRCVTSFLVSNAQLPAYIGFGCRHLQRFAESTSALGSDKRDYRGVTVHVVPAVSTPIGLAKRMTSPLKGECSGSIPSTCDCHQWVSSTAARATVRATARRQHRAAGKAANNRIPPPAAPRKGQPTDATDPTKFSVQKFACPLSRSLFGIKRTCLSALHMSAFDPKRTLRWHGRGDGTRASGGVSARAPSVRF